MQERRILRTENAHLGAGFVEAEGEGLSGAADAGTEAMGAALALSPAGAGAAGTD